MKILSIIILLLLISPSVSALSLFEKPQPQQVNINSYLGTYNIPTDKNIQVMFLDPSTNLWYSVKTESGKLTISNEVIPSTYYLYPSNQILNRYVELGMKITNTQKVSMVDKIHLGVLWMQTTKMRAN